ncbi:hypothetical protein GCM10022254_24700 [Actinomadura meridiana]|uniref:Uncharacterized protein n=1 Tax=Actinomadura meridiana TaxID=559626 RepID=A0ABP8BYM1_9ACTN
MRLGGDEGQRALVTVAAQGLHGAQARQPAAHDDHLLSMGVHPSEAALADPRQRGRMVGAGDKARESGATGLRGRLNGPPTATT